MGIGIGTLAFFVAICVPRDFWADVGQRIASPFRWTGRKIANYCCPIAVVPELEDPTALPNPAAANAFVATQFDEFQEFEEE